MRSKLQYKSRFKILKGGKIGLIISAVLSAVTLSFASPSGGVLSSGTATISQSGKITNINQSTNKASINWQSFGIQTDETVNFIQPNSSSITLNRVIGNEKSIIDGALNANGQVWILNSNGVLFGSNAKINTSGLLTTTKELSDTDFQNSNYSFTGDSSNSIINQGTITIQNNGYVILASNEVKNSGIIEVVKGKVHLIGANEYTLNLNGNSLVELTIDKGVLDALVENSGTIINNGGEVYLTTNAVDELLGGVVNHTGIIEANSLDGITGEVELYAHGGTANIDGTIEAKDGFVETSGKNLSVADSFSIVADTWLLDPEYVTIESSGGDSLTGESVSATAIQSALSGTTDVELQATYDITVNEDISWDEATKLKLTAGDEIYVNATIENTNATYGGVYFNADNTTDKVIFGANGKVIINNIYQLQWINTALQGTYELGSNINANATSSWNSGKGFDPIGYYNSSSDYEYFTGSFDGNSYTIDSLYINRSSEIYVGLFGYIGSGSSISNIGLIDTNISGANYVGGLAGVNYGGTIINSYATGSVTGEYDSVGGLVGWNNEGTIKNSYATGNVIGDDSVGGLVGWNYGDITNSYATGSVIGDFSVGGLVGWNNEGTIKNSYATGSVTGNDSVGGLVGYNYGGTITSSYWDIETSGQSSSAGGTGLTTEQFTDPTYFSTWDSTIWQLGGTEIEGYGLLSSPYLKEVTQESDKGTITTLFESGWGTEASPYPISTWVDLANIAYNSETLSFYYDLINNLTTSTSGYSTYASENANDGKGWDPIGDGSDAFTGTFDGNNYTIDSLYINRSSEDNIGLFGYTGSGSSISNLGLIDVDISGRYWVGGLVGYNYYKGTITNSYATGSVNGISNVGGLVGYNYGDITNSYATGSVDGNYYVGGLVGYNNVRGTITNSYATGSVSGDDAVGGLVGKNYRTITNSYATGSVDGISNVGGLVGESYGTITKSYWNTETSGQTTSDGGTGLTTEQFADSSYFSTWDSDIWQLGESYMEGYGLLSRPYLKEVTQESDIPSYTTLFESGWGTEASPYTISTWAQLANIDYNSDTLQNGYYYSLSSDLDSSTIGYSTYASENANDGEGWDPIGDSYLNSFIGSFDGLGHTISNLYINTTNYYTGLFGYIGSGSSISNIGLIDTNISGTNYVGGLVGVNYGGTIKNSYLTSGRVKGYSDVGGLVGYNSGDITNSYATAEVSGTYWHIGGLVGLNWGDITNSYATGSVIGEDESVGGLVGYNYSSGTITSSYASGYVEGTSRVGGLVGYNDAGTITSSYWDTETSGQTDGIGGGTSSSGVTGLTSEEMAYGGSYDSSWNIEVDTTLTSGDAPVLRYNDDGTATWIIAPLELTYILDNQIFTYNGTQNLSSFYTTSSIFGSNYNFIDLSDYSFVDGSNNTISTVKNAGTYTIGLASENQFLAIASTGNTQGTITITPKTLTITGLSAEDKTYDGTTLATLVNSGTLSGFVGTETIDYTVSSANFDTKNVGTNKTVIADYTLTDGTNGGLASNYILSNTTTSANIIAKELSATYSAENKTYDGTTLADVTGTLSDIISGDDVTLSQSASYEDKNVGENKQVTIFDIALSGDDASNYTLASATANTTADITAKTLTITGLSAEDKTYDGTTLATLVNSGTLSGFVGTETIDYTVSAHFDTKNVGTNKTVTADYTLTDGTNGGLASNYTVASATTTANITPKSVTVSYSASDKIYDSTTDAVVIGSSSDIINGDDVSINYTSATFEDKNVGENKQVTIFDIALSGADAQNYYLLSNSAIARANISNIDLSNALRGMYTQNMEKQDIAKKQLEGFNMGDFFNSLKNGSQLNLGFKGLVADELDKLFY